MTTDMTKGEREELHRLVRSRERVLKSGAKQRSLELLADFENQMGQEFRFDQDEIWEKATELAEREVAKAQKVVAARCRELGIPERFAPGLQLRWSPRGYDNQVNERKSELRNMAKTQIAAIEAKAITEIEQSCLEASTQIVMGVSSAARDFIENLPPINKLMPKLTFSEIAGEADPPVAEQLMSSSALRMRRLRERKRVTSQSDDVTSRDALLPPDTTKLPK